ncbi:MAG TPA: asparagine synthase-related protein [Gemmatimonadaceae bacterium]|nr:asparagine synthase-related protein [Gemmatimonadaceae bacterium]
MSAICAIYRWDGSSAPAGQVETLLGAMREYGSDAVPWKPESPESPVALGCIPWRITPEDACYRGPERSAEGNVVAVVDARLDNREELTRALGIGTHEAARMSDAAFIVAGWRHWKHETPRHLVGDFAFALWDGQRRELFCARDAMGQRVLFYHESPARLAIATTPHALTTLPDVPVELDEQKVADFLVLLQRPEITFFRGIKRLAPGHTLTAGSDGMRIERYWSPAPSRMLRLESDQAYVEAFRDVFETAVRAQLRCEGTVAMMASGGLDSSSVAAVAASLLRDRGQRLPTYHAAPREGFTGPVRRGMVADESGDVRALAAMHPNIDLHVRRTDDRSPFEELETSFRMAGAPPRNPPNAAWFYGIYAQAADAGARVLLTGHKGNATVSQTGLRSLRDSALKGEWRHLYREVRALGRATGKGRRDVLRREVVQPLTPPAMSAALRWLRRTNPKPVWDDTLSAINPDFARNMNVEERVRAANRHHHDINRLSDMDFRLTVLAGGADVFDLYSGMRPWFGIETRDPTADRRVVEFCMAVPGSQYLKDGVTRSLIRRAMAGLLPDQIRLRSTFGQQAPDWSEWLPKLRAELQAELAALQQWETARRCLDLSKMQGLLNRWPDRLTLAHEKDYLLLLMRGVTMGRFIRWFEDTYA